MPNPAFMAIRTARAIAVTGTICTFTRVTGVAPNAVITTVAGVAAVVRNAKADDLEGRREGFAVTRSGGLQFSDRDIIVMANALAGMGIVPLQKGDRIVVAASGDKLEVTEVDLNKLSLSGAIEAVAVGV